MGHSSRQVGGSRESRLSLVAHGAVFDFKSAADMKAGSEACFTTAWRAIKIPKHAGDIR